MSRSDIVFFRAGYVICLDAWQRYFTDGHSIRFDDDTAVYEESSDEDDGEEEPREGDEPISEEEKQLIAEEDSICDRVTDYRQSFRGLYREASPDVRTRLVLPHSDHFSLNVSLRWRRQADRASSLHPYHQAR